MDVRLTVFCRNSGFRKPSSPHKYVVSEARWGVLGRSKNTSVFCQNTFRRNSPSIGPTFLNLPELWWAPQMPGMSASRQRCVRRAGGRRLEPSQLVRPLLACPDSYACVASHMQTASLFNRLPLVAVWLHRMFAHLVAHLAQMAALNNQAMVLLLERRRRRALSSVENRRRRKACKRLQPRFDAALQAWRRTSSQGDATAGPSPIRALCWQTSQST